MKIFTLVLTSTLALFTHAAYSQGSAFSLRFDGNDYIVADNVVNDVAGGSFSVALWYKSEPGIGPNECLIAFNTAGTGLTNNILVCNQNMNHNNALAAYPADLLAALTDQQWHHITYVLDAASNEARLYLDGQLRVTTATTATINPTDRFSLAQEWDGASTGNFMHASLDEVSIWDQALTEIAIRENMCQKLSGSEPNLVAYYRMDEGIDNSCSGGEDVCDLTGNGNHGTKF